MNRPLISVICAVHNGMSTIEGAVSSIIAQHYSNWEMIIVDDGSTDGTVQMVRPFVEHDQRVRIIEPRAKIGRSQALNLALKEASGLWVANIDADDPSHPLRLARQVAVASRVRSDVAAIATRSMFVRGMVTPEWDHYSLLDPLPKVDISQALLRKNVVNHSSILMRREIVIELGGYNEELNSSVDYDLWLRMISRDYRVYLIDERLATKRLHSEQSYENRDRLQYLFNSSTVQFRHLCSMRSRIPFMIFIYPFARFFYGMLPPVVRHCLAKR